MAFQARHRWIIQRLQMGLGFQDEAQVEELLKTNRIMDKLAHFFRADGPSTVFFYFQARGDSDATAPSTPAASDRKELFIADGLDDAFRGRALFFAKVPPNESPHDGNGGPDAPFPDATDETGPETDTQRASTPTAYASGGEVDPAVANDHRLTFGVLDSSALLSLETTLSQLYAPLLLTAERDDDPNGEWGQADTDGRTEFLHGLKLFVTDVQENLKAMSTGLDLRKPDKRYDPSDTRSLSRLSTDDSAVVHFSELMREWCKQTEAYLEDNDQTRWESHESGPDTELEYWKRRLQRLMGITEQLKTKECKMVTGVLNVVSKLQQGDSSSAADRLGVTALLRQWKQIDTNITEASNEAKDNVKYLATLERFIEPLYSGTPATVIDALPALMNAVKMVHTIARYYNTTERMTKLFMKITNQMITLCKYSIVPKDAPAESIWAQDPEDLLQALEACLKLNEAYQEQYRLTKDKLLTMPKGKQFDFSETQIFGKFDLFCRRVVKLIDMFSTIHQFRALAQHALEGMDTLLASFNTIISEFRTSNKHDLLDYHNNKFDRDYVEFNIQIADLEASLQQFINVSFDSITSIEQSLLLLKQFQSILQRESLRSDLDSKFTVIFHNYGLDLTNVQDLYEKCRHDPPVARNLPPVAGNILWSRHLLRRIEEPMRKFESNPTVLSTKDSKKIIKTYNKVARTLVAFEYLWYEAWCRSVETAKAGLHATLIIRHPETSKLYVNFDKAILQLIREARCLDRMGIEVPENARIVMLQEDKFKMYYNDLTYTLKEYDRVLGKIIPVAEKLLVPHLEDLQHRLRPGLVTLTWTSMNIDAYTTQVHAGLQRLEELINNVLDAIENRIEKNLKVVARASLVNLPTDQSFALDDFVRLQEKHVATVTLLLGAKNVEIENAVEDVLRLLCDYTIDGINSTAAAVAVTTSGSSSPTASTQQQQQQQQQQQPRRTVACDVDAMNTFRSYYRNLFYRALVNSTKTSLDAIKKRVCSKAGTGFLFLERPFFEVDVQLSVPSVRLSPSLDDIQRAINRSAVAVLKCSKSLYEWGQQNIFPESARTSLFEKLGCDTEIIKVAILLTGALHGTKNQVHEYLATFKKYDWLWKEDMEFRYSQFMKRNPLIQDFEHELRHFMAVEAEILHLAPVHNIAVLSLNTKNLKLQLRNECRQWKVQYSDRVHSQARSALSALTEYIRVTTLKLSAPVESLDALRFVMGVLREVRERESAIEMEIAPILDMYDMLEHFLPGGYMDKDEMDQKSVIRSSWRRLVDYAEEVTDNLSEVQGTFKKQLIKDVREFQADVAQFRADYCSNGPMVSGIAPAEAVARLKRFKDLLITRERKLEVYSAGEELFGMRPTEYPELIRTKKELALLDQLYGLYMDVATALTEFQALPWSQVSASVQRMSDTFAAFDARCKKLPKKLSEWEAYHILRKDISDFVDVLPLMRELCREAIKPRHWDELVQVCSTSGSGAPCSLVAYDSDAFTFRDVLNARLLTFKDDVEYVCESAQKQLQIETKIRDIKERWAGTAFEFGEWRARGVPVLKGYGQVIEDLEESQLQLQAMLSMRHVVFFKESVQSKLAQLSETADVLERWVKVQTLWMSLESVFTGGDIAKQMPLEAKKFAKIDKDWQKVMTRASELGLVVACCANELLRSTLPMLFSELEKCQKSLEGYLEQKRRKFPRFYFVSNPLLLLILSRGCSDPMAVQQYYEKIFDSVDEVVHDSADKRRIIQIKSRIGGGSSGGKDVDEIIPLATGVVADGNIEDWLRALEREMRVTLKGICRQAAAESSAGMSSVRDFVSRFCAQFALLGIQLSWTAECQEALQRCRTTKGVMSQTSKRHGTMLSELSSWCLTDLGSKLARTKVETLITIQVHQRDVFLELCRLYKEKKLVDGNDFEWLKQARFYWRPANSANGAYDLVGPDACIISIGDIDFKYAFEYLGCKERLVITPLTDRAYITLSQALGMHLGGAPAGPAGTGKTETVKDLGRSLGVFVIVTNCTDQQRFSDMAKIFKGLCQGGLWGCFDEFNRIELPVLSVVAQQVLAITNARRLAASTFSFPGDPAPIALHPDVGYFITMNPGYQGRQELPENLKALFRGVSMMVPDREIIIKVRLCAVGYDSFAELARKFKTLYGVCEEQLSKQRHYDFGLRNILSVLRTAGATKRANLLANEEVLLMTTLRDMNLSKLVAPDIPIFLSMLRDIFPGVVDSSGSGNKHSDIKRVISDTLSKNNRIARPTWTSKVLQLLETLLVRHGIMLVGPAGAGKSEICRTLQTSLSAHTKTPHRQVRMNPKAIRAEEMFGETDKLSGEWVDGVFAAMWAKFNDRSRKDVAWIVCDGPVDAVWIENLNTVLDDNKILTLANGDRLPMTDNCKLLFEVEDLRNASPATVSRAGIIYVSDTDLDWEPVAQGWLLGRPETQREALSRCVRVLIGSCSGAENPSPRDGGAGGDNIGHLFEFLVQHCRPVVFTPRVALVQSCLNLLQSLLACCELSEATGDLELELARLFVFSIVWAIGGVLDLEDRRKLHEYLSAKAGEALASTLTATGGGSNTMGAWMPSTETSPMHSGSTIFDHFLHHSTLEWERWSLDSSHNHSNDGPTSIIASVQAMMKLENINMAHVVVPTTDTARALYLMERLHSNRHPVLLVGEIGTGKSTLAHLFLNSNRSGNSEEVVSKTIIFSGSSSPGGFQATIEGELDKRGGKTFGPTNGKKLTFFLDDLALPARNTWGDQPTLEVARQIVETGTLCFLDKDKRGDLKSLEDLRFVAAMRHAPRGSGVSGKASGSGSKPGRMQDIPSRLKRHFMVLNVLPPTPDVVETIYGQLVRWRFAELFEPVSSSTHAASTGPSAASPTPQVTAMARKTIADVAGKLAAASVQLWDWMRRSMLPTPQKFHYVFNMRELSRCFQGILRAPIESLSAERALVKLWKHECERVFADRLVSLDDKRRFQEELTLVSDTTLFKPPPPVKEKGGGADHHHSHHADPSIANAMILFVDFLRDAEVDEYGEVVKEAPRYYEPAPSVTELRARVEHLLSQHQRIAKEGGSGSNSSGASNASGSNGRATTTPSLILFDEALSHLVRISRVLGMPQSNMMLVGVGGSGKQSLARLASMLEGHQLFQIAATKGYNLAAFLDDLRSLFKTAGQVGRGVTFLLTEAEIKDDSFLEHINSLLAGSGELPGLFPRDELAAMVGELRGSIAKDKASGLYTGGSNDYSLEHLVRYFFDRARANLHVVLCLSPVSARFAPLCREYPHLVAGCTIDWFLPWPEDALIAVSRAYLSDLPLVTVGTLSAADPVKEAIMAQMARIHLSVESLSDEYFIQMRRKVFQTPRSFLSFLATYRALYNDKLQEIARSESSINIGLQKLTQGAQDVERMKLVLKDEEAKLATAEAAATKMLENLQIKSLEAKKESDLVERIKEQCLAEAIEIGKEKSAAEEDLARAQPFLDEAERAVSSIKPNDLNELKKLAKPGDIIKLIFDCVAILQMAPMLKVERAQITLSVVGAAGSKDKRSQVTHDFILDSFQVVKSGMLADTRFLQNVFHFSKYEKDNINDETVELMQPYLELEGFSAPAARNASRAAEGLFCWVQAMTRYHEASKVVKPKLEALRIAEGKFEAAQASLAASEQKLAQCQGVLTRLQDAFQAQMEEKARVEAYAAATRKKMEQATALIGGLAGERARWTDDSNRFVERKIHLVGDCAVAAAFLSYAGAFNRDFRTKLVQQRVPQELTKRSVPLSPSFALESFLVDVATLSDWSLQGLPTDPLSIQNGILVARATGMTAPDGKNINALNTASAFSSNSESSGSSASLAPPPAGVPTSAPTQLLTSPQTPTRYPLLIDPQGQAVAWVMRREGDRLPTFGIVPATSPKLRDQVEFCVSEGCALIIDGVDGATGSQSSGDGVDPLIHSLLDHDVVVRAKTAFIRVLDRLVELHEDFRLYLVTRLPAPVFSPELQARAVVVDFTVTQHGLEEQLLAQVIQKEQRSLEEQLQRVQNELSTNTKALVALDALLLERLSANDAGNLLDDVELVTVLAHTKVKAKEVNDKIAAAEDMKRGIDDKREAYRPVATRGAALYFALVDLTAVNTMYQASLDQFLVLFRRAIDASERASLASKRVANILETLTYTVYRYVNRGLYERHKLGFLLMMALKMLIAADTVTSSDVSLLLKAGAARKLSPDQPKPFGWLSTQSWLNVLQLSNDKPLFRSLIADIERGEAAWRRWYDHNEPERQPVPEYDPAVFGNSSTTTANLLFHKLLLVRALREDRTLLAALEFIKSLEVIEVSISTNTSTINSGVVMRLPALGPKYTEPVTDTVEGLFADLAPEIPALFLLSAGADPTEAVELLARRKRQMVACISMGEGQEAVAARAVSLAMLNGSWVLLQNCHLGLEYLETLEETLARISSVVTNASSIASSSATASTPSGTNASASAGSSASSSSPPSTNCSPEFRIFLTAEPHDAFPISLLHRCARATNEPPAGLRAGLVRSFTVIVDQDKLERVETQAWRSLLFALCFLHSVVQERRKFGALGFAIPYEFNAGDLSASLSFLERHLYGGTSSMSWTTIQYMVAEVHYGGRITDEMDRRLFRAYCEAWLNPTLLSGSFAFFSPDSSVLNSSGGTNIMGGSLASGNNSSSFHYGVPEAADVEEIQRVLASYPKVDSPEVFGLHPNADLTFRNNEAAALLTMISETQPKDQPQAPPSSQQRVGASLPAETREDVALKRARELLTALPSDFGEVECAQIVRAKLGGPALPLNICLLQEIQRLQVVLELVRGSLEHAQRLLAGEAGESDSSGSSSNSSSTTSSVRNVLDALVDGQVPRSWRFRDGSGDEISWRASTLGQWVAGLTDRGLQLRSWLDRGRPTTFWLAGFMNPQGFLTAVAQEVARHHASERWALDDVVLHAEVTDYERPEQVKSAPRDGGILVHGLLIDGAAWSRAESSLVEAEPKKLFASLPVVYVTATTRAQKKTRAGGDYGPYGGYEAPCYQYASRTDRFYVMTVVMASRDHRPLHWTLRGVALLCSPEQ